MRVSRLFPSPSVGVPAPPCVGAVGDCASLAGPGCRCCADLPCPPGVQFEVKRVELQGSSTLFCCWLVKDLLHSHWDSATRTRLLLASLPSSSHSMCELSGPSVGEVGVCAQLLPRTYCMVWEGVLPGLFVFLSSASSGMGGGSF